MAALTPLLLQANGTAVLPPGSLPQKLQMFTGYGYALILNITGSLTATVQVTNDPNYTANLAICRWNNHDVLQNLTQSANSSLVYPVAGLQLIVTNWVSGSAQLQIGLADYQV